MYIPSPEAALLRRELERLDAPAVLFGVGPSHELQGVLEGVRWLGGPTEAPMTSREQIKQRLIRLRASARFTESKTKELVTEGLRNGLAEDDVACILLGSVDKKERTEYVSIARSLGASCVGALFMPAEANTESPDSGIRLLRSAGQDAIVRSEGFDWVAHSRPDHTVYIESFRAG